MKVEGVRYCVETTNMFPTFQSSRLLILRLISALVIVPNNFKIL